MIRPYLIDVDGVCIDWWYGFRPFAARHGTNFPDEPHSHDLTEIIDDLGQEAALNLVEQFSHTQDYWDLPPVKGAVEALEGIRERNPYALLIAISACGDDDMTRRGRKYQLRHFPFDAVIHLPLLSSKDTVYAQFAKGIVIDDHAGHVRAAMVHGHAGYIFHQPWNCNVDGPWTRLYSWDDFQRLESRDSGGEGDEGRLAEESPGTPADGGP